MWTFLTGYLLSNFFEFGTIELFKKKFVSKTISIDKIIIGWLLEEYTKEKFAMSGGKTFIFTNDYRNQFTTHILEVIRNFFFYSHLIIFLELVSFFSFFSIFSYLIATKFKLELKSNFVLDSINKMILASNLSFIYIYLFFKKFSWFDIFFILKPILLVFFLILMFLPFLILNYLLYKIVFKKFSKKLSFLLKLYLKKIIFNFIYMFNFFGALIYVFNIQNLTTENFLKEIFFTFLIFLKN